jgi:hypothetical protein
VTSGAFLGPGWGFPPFGGGSEGSEGGILGDFPRPFYEDRREFSQDFRRGFGDEKISKKNRSLR